MITNPNKLNISIDGLDGDGKTTLIENIREKVSWTYNSPNSSKSIVNILTHRPKSKDIKKSDISDTVHQYKENLIKYIEAQVRGRILHLNNIPNEFILDQVTIPKYINIFDRGFFSTFIYAYVHLVGFDIKSKEEFQEGKDTYKYNKYINDKANELFSHYINFERYLDNLISNILIEMQNNTVGRDHYISTTNIVNCLYTDMTILLYTHNNVYRENINKKSNIEDSCEYKNIFEKDIEFAKKIKLIYDLFINRVYGYIDKVKYINPYIGTIRTIPTTEYKIHTNDVSHKVDIDELPSYRDVNNITNDFIDIIKLDFPNIAQPYMIDDIIPTVQPYIIGDITPNV